MSVLTHHRYLFMKQTLGERRATSPQLNRLATKQVTVATKAKGCVHGLAPCGPQAQKSAIVSEIMTTKTSSGTMASNMMATPYFVLAA
jgi:hypothetical protein